MLDLEAGCRPTEAVMVSKCANPDCSAPFRYLHEGRIFALRAGTPVQLGECSERVIERYWLCNACCVTKTLVLRDGAVTLRTLEIPAMEAPPKRATHGVSRQRSPRVA